MKEVKATEDFENQIATDEPPKEIIEENETEEVSNKKKSAWNKAVIAVFLSVSSIFVAALIAFAAFFYYEHNVFIPKCKDKIEELGISDSIDVDDIKITDIIKSGIDVKKLITNKDNLSVDDIRKLAIKMGYSEDSVNSVIEKYTKSSVKDNVNNDNSKTNKIKDYNSKTAPTDYNIETDDYDFLDIEIPYEDFSEYNEYSKAYTPSVPLPEDHPVSKVVELKGNGTQNDPYLLETYEDVVTFSRLVGRGNFSGSDYISLQNDIDFGGKQLNPIGSSTHPFTSNFDGNGHTISNIEIVPSLEQIGNLEKVNCGFFGVASNPTVKNFRIKNAKVELTYSNENGMCQVGLLFGDIESGQGVKIYNCKISGEIILEAEPARVGGICGSLFGFASCSQITVKQVEVDVNIVSKKSFYQAIGSAFGDFTMLSKNATISDLCLKSNINVYNISCGYTGAFGVMNVYNEKGEFTVENTYIHTAYSESNVTLSSRNALFGCPLLECEPWGNITLKNVFGYIDTSNSLFFNGHKKPLSVVNSAFTDKLPSNCNFDTSIWDISDSSNPKLK